MNCIIIEDEPLALKIVKSYVDKVPFLNLNNTFRDPLKALDYLQKEPIDLLFLDINMPDLSGIQLLKTLQHPPLVIFTTAYSQYAIESYDFDAVDYLLKPIEFDRFLKAVNKANQRFQDKNMTDKSNSKSSLLPKKDIYFVKSGTKTYKVKAEDILYLESENNYVGYVTEKRKILSSEKISRLEKILPKDQFVRVHKSYIIGIRHIDVIQKEFITIQSKRIPIGRAYRVAFFDLIKKS